MPVFPTFKRRQIVKGSKNEEGKEFHRLFVLGKKQELFRFILQQRYLLVLSLNFFIDDFSQLHHYKMNAKPYRKDIIIKIFETMIQFVIFILNYLIKTEKCMKVRKNSKFLIYSILKKIQ